MVYLTIPPELTKEELMLKERYAILRRLQKKLNTSIQEPIPKKEAVKRSLEAKPDAREAAKKLLKSGAISAIKKENKEKTTFKRPTGAERKNSDRKSSSKPLFTPPDSRSSSLSPSFRPAKKLYDNFVSAGTLQEEVKQNSYRKPQERKTAEKTREKNVVYVCGYDQARGIRYALTREFLQKIFESIGNIIKIYIPVNKQFAFVTFMNNELAYKAIQTLHDTVSDGIKFNVFYANIQSNHLPSNREM